VEVADFSLCTVGFSGPTGRGILESQGRSGEGGACNLGEGLLLGPAMMPSATFWISLLHLSHNFNLEFGCSVSGVVKGLPWAGRLLLVKARTMADVEAVLVITGLPPILASRTDTLALTSTLESVMVP